MTFLLPWALAAVVALSFLAAGPGPLSPRLGAVARALGACAVVGGLGLLVVGALDEAACGAVLDTLRLRGPRWWISLDCLSLSLNGLGGLGLPCALWLVLRWRALARSRCYGAAP